VSIPHSISWTVVVPDVISVRWTLPLPVTVTGAAAAAIARAAPPPAPVRAATS